MGWAFYVQFSMFCISLFWPGMVLNQGQLSIVVSDWAPYLDSPFSHLSLWVVHFVCGTIALKLHGRFVWFIVLLASRKIKEKCTITTLRFGPVLSKAMTRKAFKKITRHPLLTGLGRYPSRIPGPSRLERPAR